MKVHIMPNLKRLAGIDVARRHGFTPLAQKSLRGRFILEVQGCKCKPLLKPAALGFRSRSLPITAHQHGEDRPYGLRLAAEGTARLGDRSPAEDVEMHIGAGTLDKSFQKQSGDNRTGKTAFRNIVEVG